MIGAFAENIRKMMGWCPNASITERKTRVEYDLASINAGLPVKRWKFDLLILGHVCALLFASLFILPMSVYHAFDLYNSSYLALNYGNFLADITLSVASMLFSVTTVVLIYNTLIFKKSHSKLCHFNVILLSGLFIAIILELSLVDNHRLEESLYWAFVFALLPSIPSLMNIRFNKKYGEQKIVTEGLGLVELIKRAMGWCPDMTVIKSKPKLQFENLAVNDSTGTLHTPIEGVVLWLSWLFGILNLPIAFIVIIDGSIISTILNPSDLPQTAEQWIGFLTAISAIVGAVAGLTTKSYHSLVRKMIHLFIAITGIVITFNALVRLYGII